MILDIVIQFGKFFSEGSKNDANWLDWFLKYFLTPFFSFSIALYLYYLKRRDDEKKEEEKKIKSNYNDFKYFNTVIIDIVKDLSTQIDGYEEYSKALNEEPFKTHQLGIVNSENLNRLVNKFDQQKIFHSYIAQFEEKETDKAIDMFMALYNALDVYLILYNDAITINSRLNEDIHNRLNNDYMNLFVKGVRPNLDKFRMDMKNENPKFYELLNEIVIEYLNNEKPTPEISQEFYILKIIEQHELLSKYPLGIAILDDCHIMTGIYQNVINNSIYQSTIIDSIRLQLEELRDKIKAITETNSIIILTNKKS